MDDTEEKIQLLKRLFRGRSDVVPKYWEKKEDGTVINAGYSPMCANEWENGLCQKGKEKDACKSCVNKKYILLSDDLLRQHIEGRVRLGVYPLLEDNTCNFIAADFDDHDGMRDPYADIKKFVEVCLGQDIECYVERSKSGKGYHVYTFFETPVQARMARAMYFALLKDAQVIEDRLENVTLESFDRLFPSQDEMLKDNSYGNLISLPLQGSSFITGNTVFLDPETNWTEPYADQTKALGKVVKMADAQVDQFIKEWEISVGKPVSGGVKVASLNEQLDALLFCDFLKWAFEHQAEVKEPLWFAMISNLASVRPNGIRLCHKFSRQYPKYSQKETQEKIFHAIDASGPHTCATIHKNGFECKKECGVKSPICLYQSIIKDQSTQVLTVKKENSGIQNISIKPFLPDIPTPSNLVFPSNYSYENGMLYTTVERYKELLQVLVANEPVFITGILHEVETNNEYVEIAAYHNGKWIAEIVPRSVIASQKEIISLANKGFPVTSSTAKFLVDYFQHFEHANRSILPIENVTKTLGWQSGIASFVWGDETIHGDSSTAHQIRFKGEDDGDEKLGKGLIRHGSYEKWIKAVNLLFDYPKAIGMIYFSLMAPFIEILGMSNFTVDLAGETSTGKTTVLRCAASCWGNPDGGSEGRLVHPWESSVVWRERTASLLRGIPFILDDTRPVRRKEEIGQFIYQFGNGEGRGRGTKQGLQSTRHIRSILLSSGEANLTEYTKGEGGVYGRLISVWGAPFGSGNQGDLVVILNETVRENFGHAGPKVVEFILQKRERWDVWKETYTKHRTVFNTKANGNNLAGRMGEYFAGLSTVIPLIHEALPDLRRDIAASVIVDDLWNNAFTSEREIDTCTQALEILYGWAVANKPYFWNQNGSDNNDGDKRCSGRWDKDGDFISFDRETARKILSDVGYEPETNFKTMKDREWLVCDKNNNTKLIKINGLSVRQYYFRKETIEKVLNLKEKEPV